MEAPLCVALPPACGPRQTQLARLPQDYQTPDGPRHHQEAIRKQLLSHSQGVHPRLSDNVHQLLRVQQAWRGEFMT